MSIYAPWYVVAWRLPWFLVAQVARVALVACVFMANGPGNARRMWSETQ